MPARALVHPMRVVRRIGTNAPLRICPSTQFPATQSSGDCFTARLARCAAAVATKLLACMTRKEGMLLKVGNTRMIGPHMRREGRWRCGGLGVR